MPSRVKRKNNAWYVVTKDAARKENWIPCLLFGEATDARDLLMGRIIDAIVAQVRARRPEGRKPDPKPCPVCAGQAPAADTSLAAIVSAAVAAISKKMGGA